MFIDELGKHNYELGKYNLDYFLLESKNKIEPIDENGYIRPFLKF